VKKQYRRNHNLWEAKDEDIPVYGTIASQFNDPGMNTLYKVVMDKIAEKTGANLKSTFTITKEMSEKIFVIRQREQDIYLRSLKIIVPMING